MAHPFKIIIIWLDDFGPVKIIALNRMAYALALSSIIFLCVVSQGAACARRRNEHSKKRSENKIGNRMDVCSVYWAICLKRKERRQRSHLYISQICWSNLYLNGIIEIDLPPLKWRWNVNLVSPPIIVAESVVQSAYDLIGESFVSLTPGLVVP